MAIINVQNMNCNKCVERIKNALDGAKIEANIELASKTVEVEDALFEKAKEELDDIGFIVE